MVVVDPSAVRIAAAKNVGVDQTIDEKTSAGRIDAVLSLTAGRGADGVGTSGGGSAGVVPAAASSAGGPDLVLDGSERVERILDTALEWDAMGGVARRAWARNDNAIETVSTWNRANAARGHVTVPRVADDELLEELIDTR